MTAHQLRRFTVRRAFPLFWGGYALAWVVFLLWLTR